MSVKKMIKQLTLEEIEKALREYPSAEPDKENIEYFIHVTYAGGIVSNLLLANKTFSATRSMGEYFDGLPDDLEEDWGAACAWVEDLGDGRFDAVCKELLYDANKWLARHEKVFSPYGWDGDEVEERGTVYSGLNALREQLEEELPYDGRTWDLREVVIGAVEDSESIWHSVEWSDGGRVGITDCEVELDGERNTNTHGVISIRFKKEEHFILGDDGEILEGESRTIKFY